MNKMHLYISVIAVIMFSSCSVSRYVPEDKHLFRDYEIEFSEGTSVHDRKQIENEISYALRPQPNDKFLGISYLGLWAHYKYQSSETKIGKWIFNRFAREPVYISDVDLSLMEKIVQKEFQDRGYFNTDVEANILEKKNFGTINYKVSPQNATRIDTVIRQLSDTALDSLFNTYEDYHVKKNRIYDLKLFEWERTELTKYIRSKGYFDFNPESIFYLIDTSDLSKSVNVTMRLEKPEQDSLFRIYQIDKVNVYVIRGERTPESISNELIYNDLNIFQDEVIINKETLDRNILIRKGQLFSDENHETTLSRLLNLNIFKYVNIVYEKSGVDGLNVNIYLTPDLNQSVQYDIEANTSDQSLVGSSVRATYQNTNTLQRAENFNASISLGNDFQYVNDQVKLAVLNSNLGLNYTVPRILSPFHTPIIKGSIPPKTYLNLNNDFQLWLSYYTMNSANLNYGYKWNNNRNLEYTFDPLFINLVNVFRTTETFDSIIDLRPSLRGSYQDIFLIGSQFNIGYTSKYSQAHLLQTYINFHVETSGNTFNLLTNTLNSPVTGIAGVDVSQYVKAELEVKFNKKTGPLESWVSRVKLGVVRAYGGSDVAPFTKRFFIGGPTTLRGFEFRTVGPGRYNALKEGGLSNPIEQTGELMLLINTEYRFPIYSVFRGAVFIDAGNIWLDREEDIDGFFNISTFYQEMALNSGFGLRLELDILAVRLDLGVPLYTPYNDEGTRWINQYQGNGGLSWIRDNMVFNAGIGYPF